MIVVSLRQALSTELGRGLYGFVVGFCLIGPALGFLLSLAWSLL